MVVPEGTAGHGVYWVARKYFAISVCK